MKTEIYEWKSNYVLLMLFLTDFITNSIFLFSQVQTCFKNPGQHVKILSWHSTNSQMSLTCIQIALFLLILYYRRNRNRFANGRTGRARNWKRGWGWRYCMFPQYKNTLEKNNYLSLIQNMTNNSNNIFMQDTQAEWNHQNMVRSE